MPAVEKRRSLDIFHSCAVACCCCHAQFLPRNMVCYLTIKCFIWVRALHNFQEFHFGKAAQSQSLGARHLFIVLPRYASKLNKFKLLFKHLFISPKFSLSQTSACHIDVRSKHVPKIKNIICNPYAQVYIRTAAVLLIVWCGIHVICIILMLAVLKSNKLLATSNLFHQFD